MKTLMLTLRIKQVLAWIGIITIGMIMGGVVTAEAAVIAKQPADEVSLVRTFGKKVWNAVEIKDNLNGGVTIVNFKF